jgi:phosphoribosyl-AMP cyclohydrolase
MTKNREIEEGLALIPRYDSAGLIPVVAQHFRTGEVLMLAYMNDEALRLTIDTGEAHYWSRSRQKLWRKGETSGEVQHVLELRIDCDQDSILLMVEPKGKGAACHTGRRSCFYRSIEGKILRLAED